MSAVAQRGGFEVEWALTRDISATYLETYTAMAVNFTTDDRFDVTANWWTDTEERRKLGLVIGHHHTDASRVLVTVDTSPTPASTSISSSVHSRPSCGSCSSRA